MSNKKLFSAEGSFKFSRTKVELFVDCPLCFYLDRVKGISRPPGFPFSLNNAVDTLFKKEFDKYRLKQVPHPLVLSNNLDFVPFRNNLMEDWRNNFKGVEAKYKGHLFYGAVDDIWIDKDDFLYIIDYKATAKADPVITLSLEPHHDSYRRQMEFYQWLVVQNGFKVSETGFFVYTTGDNTLPEFNDVLKFRTHLIAYKGDFSWVEPTLDKLINCASSLALPEPNESCKYCKYANERKKMI
jgi:hypothetical protein